MAPIVGDGRIGIIFLPAGNPETGSSLLTVIARGDMDGIVGPGGPGKLWAVASSLLFDDLNGSITGIDHIGSVKGRWLGDSPDDELWVQHGIDELVAYGIRAKIMSDGCFEDTYDPFDGGSIITLGHGGATGSLSLGRVDSFWTAGAVDSVRIELLSGGVNLAPASSIDQLFIVGTLGATEVIADDATIATLILGERAARTPPVIQFFPLAFPLVISGYAEDFWNALSEDMRALIRGSDYQVHHTRFQQLAPVFQARGIDVHEVSSLRAVHPTVHQEITRRQWEWVDEEMKRINSNWSWNNPQHRAQFLRRVRNDNAFFQRLTQFQQRMESEYADLWVRSTDTSSRIRQVHRRMDGARSIARFQIGEGARARRLLPTLAGALVFFGLIESSLGAASLLVAGHTQLQEQKFEILLSRYRAALDRAIVRRAHPEKLQYLIPLKDALIDYLRAIGISDNVLNSLEYALEVYLAPL